MAGRWTQMHSESVMDTTSASPVRVLLSLIRGRYRRNPAKRWPSQARLYLWPKKLCAIVLVDEGEIVGTIHRKDRVHVMRLLQPVAATEERRQCRCFRDGKNATQSRGSGTREKEN